MPHVTEAIDLFLKGGAGMSTAQKKFVCDSIDGSYGLSVPDEVTTQTYELDDDDHGLIKRFTFTGEVDDEVTVTVPESLKSGFACFILRDCDSRVTIVPDTANVIILPSTRVISDRYKGAVLLWVATNEYRLLGDLGL